MTESRYPRPRRPHKLDPYKGIIDERLAEFPRLSAQRLFDEVRTAGYAGGYSRVRDYVHEQRPREPAEPAVRFETPPGRQGQVDFGTFTLPWGRRHALLVVLGHSRLLWLRFYRRQTMAVLFEGLESAFARFGGVPAELLFDQMRSVVLSDDRTAGGELVLNAEFLRFSAHWGFVARSCRAYRAQAKGKVERPICYLRDSFFYARTFAGDEDLNAQAAGWLEDPLARKRTAKVPTFRDAAAATYEANRSACRSEKVAKNWQQRLERHVLPKLGPVPVDRIGRDDVLRILIPLGATETGRKVKAIIRQTIEWAIAKG